MNFLKSFRLRYLLGFFLLVAFLFYYPTINIGFLSDDWHALHVVAHQESVWNFFTTNVLGNREGSFYAPVWNLIFTIEYNLFGLQAIGYHVVSLILFSLTAWLLSLFIFLWIPKKSIAIVTGLIFLVMANHVETVAWIIDQIHLLATLFYLASLITYTLFLKQGKNYWYWLTLGSFALSLGTKEIGITAPVVWALLTFLHSDRIWSKQTWLKVIKYLVGPVVIIILYLILRFQATGISTGYYGNSQLNFDGLAQLRMALEISVNMFFGYPYRGLIIQKAMAHLTIIYISLSTLMIISFYAFKIYRKQLSVFFIIYLITLLPYLFVGYSPQSNEGDRYAYLPSLWAIIGFVLVGCELKQRAGKIFWYMGLSTVGLGIVWQIRLLHSHVQDWELAGKVVKRGFESLEKLNFETNEQIYLIGAPDNIQGAQLFRNATFLALELKGKIWKGDRVYMLSVLPRENPDKSFVKIESQSNKLMLSITDPNFYFVGFPVVETEVARFILQPFDRTTQSGENIEINFTPKVPRARFVYYNAGQFQLLP